MIDELKINQNYNFWFNKYLFTDYQQNLFYQYAKFLQEYNQKVNLTAITELKEIYLKHFYDSLTIKNEVMDYNQIADLGSGAGFPGVVLAIVYPKKKIYLIEPLKKRCIFLQKLIKKLKLENVIIINKRAELIEQKFELVVSRAVTKLNILLELAIPLVKKDGILIALKANNIEVEVANSKKALKILNSKIISQKQMMLPIENSVRVNLIIKKELENSSKYPRKYSQIKRNPL